MIETYLNWELSLLHAIQEGATELGSLIWSLITLLGDEGIFWILVSLTLIFIPKTRKAGFTMALAMIFGLILGNGILKNLFQRARPYDLDPTLHHRLVIGKVPTDFSFPSGHTLVSFEAAFALFYRYKKWGAAALVLAFFIALSRLFLLVHDPSDILVGAVLGVLLAFLSGKIVDFLAKKKENK